MAEKNSGMTSPQRPPQPKIAVWGPTQSGKSVFLGCLHFAGCPGWLVTVNSEAFKKAVLDSLEANSCPPPTQVNEEGTALSCTFHQYNTQLQIVVEMEDRAGVTWERAAKGEQVSLQSLATADGVVLLYDLSLDRRFDSSSLDLLRNICSRLNEVWRNRETKPPIAVCFAKCDSVLFDPDDIALARQDPEAALPQVLPDGRFEHIFALYHGLFPPENGKPRVKFFPVSSLGVRNVYGSIAPVIFFDDSLASRVISGTPEERRIWPINLTEPFLWIFDRLGLVGTS